MLAPAPAPRAGAHQQDKRYPIVSLFPPSYRPPPIEFIAAFVQHLIIIKNVTRTESSTTDTYDDRELQNDHNITVMQPSENIIAIKERCHHSRLISMDIDTNHHDTTSSFTLRQHDDNGYDPNNDNTDHDTDVYPFLLNRQMIPHAADY